MKIARERKSSILASNAVHHRIDSLTSIVALVAIGGSHIFNGASWLDPVGGLIVSIMVIKAGWGNTGTALLELADVGIDNEMRSSVRKAASKALASEPTFGHSEIQVRDVQGVKAGQNYLMDIELAVPGSWTVKQMRDVEDIVRARVGSKVRGVRRVKVRFVPSENKETGFADEFIGAEISPRSSPEPEDEKEATSRREHDHEHNHPSTTAMSGNDVEKSNRIPSSK